MLLKQPIDIDFEDCASQHFTSPSLHSRIYCMHTLGYERTTCVQFVCASQRIWPLLVLSSSLPLCITDHVETSALQLAHNPQDSIQGWRLNPIQGVRQAKGLPLVAAKQVVWQELNSLHVKQGHRTQDTGEEQQAMSTI